MKSAISLLFAMTILGIPIVTLYADSDFKGQTSHDSPLADVLKEMRSNQRIGPNGKIDPEKVDDNLLEELGESFMSLIFPNSKQHEWMDNMMGGEGSDDLKSMHIRMGYSYLSGERGFMMERGDRGMMDRGARGMMERNRSTGRGMGGSMMR